MIDRIFVYAIFGMFRILHFETESIRRMKKREDVKVKLGEIHHIRNAF